MKPATRVEHGALRSFVAQIFEAKGFGTADAATVAEVLVWANLRGVDSHGVVRVPQYLGHLRKGEMNPKAEIGVRGETQAAVLIDADRAAGPLAMNAAAAAAMARARSAGIGLALVRATTHTAALGYYTSRAARDGFAAIAFAGGAPQMAYHGARGAAVSTSPLSIAVPCADREPILLDMASSVVGLGKLLQTGRAGLPIPEGWATDPYGNPSTDPATATVPLPIGGPKGSGLSLMVELLTGVLCDNPVLSSALEGVDKRHRQNGLVVTIDIARFAGLEAFGREALRLARAIKALRPTTEGGEILLPGERGYRVAETRARDGIPLPPLVFGSLASIAAELGLSAPASA